MTLSRLSDMNIEDDILRAAFYSRVFDYVKRKDSELFSYEIKIDEEYRPDLAAFRAYSNSALRWIILLLAQVTDEADPLPVGDELLLPYPSWIRQEMRRFMDEMGL